MTFLAVLLLVLIKMSAIRGFCVRSLCKSRYILKPFGRYHRSLSSLAKESVTTYDYFSVDDKSGNIQYGDYSIIASQAHVDRKFTHAEVIGTDNGPKVGETVWIRARVANVRAKGNACFVVLRSNAFYTIQACHFKEKTNPEESKKLMSFVAGISEESIVDVLGEVAKADVKSCTQHNVEIYIRKIFVVSRAPAVLPFQLNDAARSEREIAESVGSDAPYSGVSQVKLII